MIENPIYLFTGPKVDRREIAGRLDQLQKFTVKLIDNFTEISSENQTLLILDYNVISGEELVNVFRAARSLPKARILIAAKQIPIAAYQKIVELENTFTLQKPFSKSCLTGVLGKMMGEPKASPSTRFKSDLPVRLLARRTGLLIRSNMTNYSGTGAYLEYRGISLDVGDDLEIGLDSEDLVHRGERIRFPAKVVWISSGQSNGSPGVGVQFVRPTEAKIA